MTPLKNKQIEVPESINILAIALGELVEDGYKRIESIKLDGEDHEKKVVTAATFAAAQERAEAVLLLAQKLKPDPALIVLRSMQEGYFNLCYVLQTENDARLIAMFYDGANTDLRRIKQLDAVMKEETHLGGVVQGLSKATDTIKELERMRDKSCKMLQELHDPEFKKPHFPDLLTRVQRYDDTNKINGGHSHLVLDYRMAYFYLSQYTHLGTSALNALVENEPTNIQINDSDPIPKCELALFTAFAVLADTLILTLKRFDQPVEELFKQLSDKVQEIKPPMREDTKGLFRS